MRDNMGTKYYYAFSFHNKQGIINALHLFLMRYPHESLIINKERQERRYLYENNALYNRDMDSTIFQKCRKFRDNISWNTLRDCSLIQDTYSFWIRWIRYYLVPTLLLFQLKSDVFCNDTCTSILDIRWNLYYYILIILLHLKNVYHNVYRDIVYKCQQFYWALIIPKFTLSSLLHFNVGLSHFLSNTTAASLKITHLMTKVRRITSRSYNPNQNKRNFFLKKLFILLTMINMIQFPSGTLALRCYTDKEAAKSNSMECGLNTGCVKIYIDSEDMLLRKQTEKGYGYGYKPGKYFL